MCVCESVCACSFSWHAANLWASRNHLNVSAGFWGTASHNLNMKSNKFGSRTDKSPTSNKDGEMVPYSYWSVLYDEQRPVCDQGTETENRFQMSLLNKSRSSPLPGSCHVGKRAIHAIPFNLLKKKHTHTHTPGEHPGRVSLWGNEWKKPVLAVRPVVDQQTLWHQ